MSHPVVVVSTHYTSADTVVGGSIYSHYTHHKSEVTSVQ